MATVHARATKPQVSRIRVQRSTFAHSGRFPRSRGLGEVFEAIFDLGKA